MATLRGRKSGLLSTGARRLRKSGALSDTATRPSATAPLVAVRSWVTVPWQPAAFVTHDIALIKLILGCAAIIRAEDYAHGTADRFGVLEAAMPLWLWSLGCFTVGMLILSGMSLRWHTFVWLGHALGAGLYALIAIAVCAASFDGWPPGAVIVAAVPDPMWAGMCLISVAVLAAAWFTNRGGPNCQVARVACLAGVSVVALAATLSGIPIDGLRGVSPLVLMGTLHAIFAIRSGPRPLGEDQARVVKATSAPDGE